MATIPMEDLLRLMLEEKASDLHLTVGCPPALRIDGALVQLETAALEAADTEALVRSVCSDSLQAKLSESGTVDFGFRLGAQSRFRVSAFRQRGKLALAIRAIAPRILSFEEIGLPPVIHKLMELQRGLVLVTGPTGSGKSTTLASMIDSIISSRPSHVVTIEDPIEFEYQHKLGLVNQREVGVDVPQFAEALRRALRQDPDVILVGEMRDLETMETAVTAAETGHLVLSTLHTTGAARTVDRIIDSFPKGNQEQIRMQLAGNLKAVISQILVERDDQDGRVAAFEVMVNTSSIANYIRENKSFRIANDILTGATHGMVALETSLVSLYSRGLISRENVINRAQDPDVARQLLEENEG